MACDMELSWYTIVIYLYGLWYGAQLIYNSYIPGGILGACDMESSADQTKPILLSSYPLTHIYVHVK